jgi:parallel beta-helix repeat protein
MRKTVCGILLTLLLTSMLTLAFNVQTVKASGAIYIRANGSVDPPTAKIKTVDNIIYTFTDNSYDEIKVERSNIIIDGNGYTLQGSGSGNGFLLDNVSNVLIKNTNIKGFSNGVYFDSSSNNILFENNITTIENMGIWLDGSSNNTIYKNNVNATINYDGVYLQYSSNSNSISSNNLTNNRSGVQLSDSSNNSISGNKIADNQAGVWFRGSSYYNCIEENNVTANYRGILLLSHYNSIKRNNITANDYGIQLGAMFEGSAGYNSISENNMIANGNAIAIEDASNNTFHHNNFIDHNNPTFILYGTNGTSGGNIWDDGYPSGGNYWSGYEGTDQFNGPYQNETGSDGIGDTSYVLSEYNWGEHYVGNIDHYPLMSNVIVPEFLPDTKPPIVFVLSPENKTYYTSDIHLTFISNEPTSWIAYNLDGQANRTITGNMTIDANTILSGLSEGSHSLTVYVNDTSRNTGASEKIYFTVETPFWMQWWLWAIVAGVIVALAGSVYFLKKRKPKAPTAPTPPTEGA